MGKPLQVPADFLSGVDKDFFMLRGLRRDAARQFVRTALLLLATSGSAMAGPVLDQKYDSAGNFLSVLAEEFAYTAQTVTTNVSGALVAVELSAGKRPDFALQWVLDVVKVADGNPTGEILASQIIDLPSPSSFGIPRPFFRFDFSVPAVFKFGDVFALGLHPKDIVGQPGLFAGSWMGGTGDPYSGGKAYFGTHAGTLTAGAPDIDLNFRTFVTPSEVPEPNSLALFGIGVFAARKLLGPRKSTRLTKNTTGRESE